jgi:hypothetical protein
MEQISTEQIRFGKLRMRGVLCRYGLNRESAKKMADQLVRYRYADGTFEDHKKAVFLMLARLETLTEK